MASPCDILINSEDKLLAHQLVSLAKKETQRIESKFSRYRTDNIIYKINNANAEPVEVDSETADLLNLSSTCHVISNGRFDITSGVLRKAWKFDCSENVPSRKQVKLLLKYIGWEKVTWSPPLITLPKGMEIDLGGIAKEYAVDRVSEMLLEKSNIGMLVNFGGDLRVVSKRKDGSPWRVGVEDPGTEKRAIRMLDIRSGGLATSGDSRRYLLKNGIRYTHILNPMTGWTVQNAPRSITVCAGTCVEAGILSTLAMLHGRKAEQFLDDQGVINWCTRD
ncbi:FAD:protein FMN transferase [bacterium]|nr:FAD:protein FMN transferase [bacterium]